MKNIILLVSISLIILSCQKKESKGKNWPIASTAKVAKQNSDSVVEDKNTKVVIFKLPQDRYAKVTLVPDAYTGEDIPDALKVDLYKPISVKFFDNKTKNELPNIKLDGIYYSGDDDDMSLGDFNFDGKIDVVCPAKALTYRDFYSYNFYLATGNGYQLNKDFSEITDQPIAYMKLDSKKKTILAVRDAEWDESWVYQVKNNKLVLIDNKVSSRSFDEDENNSIINDSIK